jgi:hypothetical protein
MQMKVLESSGTYDKIIGQGRDILVELSTIMNFNDHRIIWDTDTIQIKDRDTALYHHQKP